MNPQSGTPRRAVRHAKPSRIPAITVLLLVIVVMLGVGLSFALAGGKDDSGGLGIGLRAGALATRDAGVGDTPSGKPPGSSLGPGAADEPGLGQEPGAGEDAATGGIVGGYSEAEVAVLAGPLPADAVKVHVPVLMYHYVDDEPPPKGPYADGLTVRTPDFVKELQYLADNGYHTVRLSDVYLAMAGVKELPEKPVALTFDDGGLDNYTVAFPLLEEYGFNGTFFVITKTVGGDGQMTWDQLREMAAAGMSIQSHTVSHPDLRGVPDERLRTELVDSREAIVEAVGEPGYALCYPAGAYDSRVIEAVRGAGYVMAVVTDKGEILDPGAVFEIRRKRVPAFLSLEGFARLVK